MLGRLKPVPAAFLKQLATDKELFHDLPQNVQQEVHPLRGPSLTFAVQLLSILLILLWLSTLYEMVSKCTTGVSAQSTEALSWSLKPQSSPYLDVTPGFGVYYPKAIQTAHLQKMFAKEPKARMTARKIQSLGGCWVWSPGRSLLSSVPCHLSRPALLRHSATGKAEHFLRLQQRGTKHVTSAAPGIGRCNARVCTQDKWMAYDKCMADRTNGVRLVTQDFI